MSVLRRMYSVCRVFNLHPINFVLFAEACGAKGLKIGDPQDCSATFQKAFETHGPVI